MKSLVTTSVLAWGVAATAQAGVLFEDGYSTVSGNYSFANDGTPTTSVGTGLSYGLLDTSGGSLDFSLFQTNSNDADSTATNDPDLTDEFLDNADVIYFSVLMQVPDLAAFGNNGGSAYAGFNTTGNNARSYGLGLQVDGAGNITYAADTGSGSANLGGSVAEGETVLLIGRITGWPDSSSYDPPSSFEYVLNPDPAAAEPGTWSSVSAVGNANLLTAHEAYLQVNAFSNSWNDDNKARFLIDELRVGMTWDDVTPLVPEPASLALLGMGGLLIMRRR